jgi:glycosyltransferase involved in cell wall biosynthesis
MMDVKPSISLCMIVKNEEERLTNCLSSAAAYVDEIVVVDTGSTDRTVEIAKSFGARIHYFEWVHDFAAARNESLRHASGDWVLQLDADERLNLLESPRALREAAAVPGVDAYVVLIRCHHGEDGNSTYSINHNFRFFRRLPGIQYEREVHESVELFLKRAGAVIAKASFLIEHEGYNVDGLELRRKLERNLDILQRYIEREPNDPYVLYYLGNTYKALGKREQSLNALEQGLRQKSATDSLKAMILNAMNLTYLTEKDYDQTIEKAKQSLNIQPQQNTARYFLGAAYYNQEEYGQALPHLFSCYQYWRLPAEKKTTTITQEYTMSEPELLKAIAICFANNNDLPQTVAFSRRFLELNKEDAQIHQILGLAFINMHNYGMALSHLEQSLRLGLEYSKIGLALAISYFRIGKIERCVEHFSKIEESDAVTVEESFRLLLLIAGEKKAASLLTQLSFQKRTLLQQASFEQLGQLISRLVRNGHLEALMAVFESVHQRVVEVEALLGGVIEFFADRDCLLEFYPVLETLADRHPRHAPFLSALGIVCIKLGNLFRAIEPYSRLHDLAPENESLTRILAGLHASTGNEAHALQILNARQESDFRTDG